ncbi:MAG: hypothetical protein ORN58_07515, partial [Sediminibacterium sp.]|nr:hypothetical protein [Sediminibacterium sp.]
NPSRIDVVEDTTGALNTQIKINKGGYETINYRIEGANVTGINIDSSTGIISLSEGVPVGLYNLIISASNVGGTVTTNLIINVKQGAINKILGLLNNSFTTTTDGAGQFGDYIDLPTIYLDSNYTVETWFKLNTNVPQNYPFIYNLNGWNNSTSNGLIMGYASTILLVKSWGVEANAPAPPNNSTGFNIAFNVWNHIAVVVNGRNTKLYINGDLIKEYTSLGMPTNNNTFTLNRIGNARDGGGNLSTTVGSYQNFRIWKKARTGRDIKATYLTPIDASSDSLYYYLPLNKPNLGVTINIPYSTILPNSATWNGAINSNSTIISTNNIGAKYAYDYTYQKIYGTLADSLQPNEQIQYSIDEGTNWKNVDTVNGLNWIATLPSNFRWGTIQVRSSTNASRVFSNYTFYFSPTISYSPSSIVDTFKTTGVSILPTSITSGRTLYSITSGKVNGINIDSITGQISWDT